MWVVVVEVGLPRSEQLVGMMQVVEQVLNQTFISHLTISGSVKGLSARSPAAWKKPSRDVIPSTGLAYTNRRYMPPSVAKQNVISAPD